MKRAVLIFGTFNPVTNAHINLGILSSQIIENADIVYVPAKDEFLRDWKGFSANSIVKNRIALLRKSVERYGFCVSSIEVEGIVDGKSINTINYMKNVLKYDEVYFCLGTDKIPELSKWYKAKELVSANHFLVFTRGKTLNDVMDDFTNQYRENFVEIREDEQYFNVSSTLVRTYISQGRTDKIKEMVPPEVYEYLKGCKDGI